MTWTLCTSGAIIAKAGVNANTDIIASRATLATFYDEAEGRIIAETRRDWVTYYSDVASGAKLALADCCSSLAAMKVTSYDMGAYVSMSEAATILDINYDSSEKQLKVLRDFKSNEIKAV